VARRTQVQRRLFTVSEYHEMAQAGILTEDDPVELIEGEILRMSPIGSRHAAYVDRIIQILAARVGRKVTVRVQNPVHLGQRSEPQPDVTLVRARPDFYARQHPGPPDILLVIEVSEDPGSDRNIKLPMYARAGIPEVWLVDLAAEVVEVYQAPMREGYRTVRKETRGKRLAPSTLAGVRLMVKDILG
jgi:Uma2 family endonuclease